MKIPKNTILGELAEKKRNKIIRNLKKNKLMMDIYILTLPMGSGVLEIYPSYILTGNTYLSNNISIVGIACGREEALDMVSDFIMDCYNTFGNFDTEKYFRER